MGSLGLLELPNGGAFDGNRFPAASGVLFGYFPARRAARLEPIEALRHG